MYSFNLEASNRQTRKALLQLGVILACIQGTFDCLNYSHRHPIPLYWNYLMFCYFLLQESDQRQIKWEEGILMGICTLLFGIHPFPTVEHPPMEYEASTSIKTSNAVTVKEITDFFVNYIKMSSVSTIANAHAAWADLAADGVLDNYCLQLAKLHSTAVDFAKSSIPAVMPAHLKPYETPDWLRCFSRRKYKSSSILGQLHSRIQEIIKDNLQIERDTCGDNLYEVDPSLLIEGHQEFETEAEYIFAEYAGEVWKIMRDFDVPQEVQMLSGFISTYLNSVSKTRR